MSPPRSLRRAAPTLFRRGTNSIANRAGHLRRVERILSVGPGAAPKLEVIPEAIVTNALEAGLNPQDPGRARDHDILTLKPVRLADCDADLRCFIGHGR